MSVFATFKRSLYEYRYRLNPGSRKLVQSPLKINTILPISNWDPNIGNVSMGPLTIGPLKAKGGYGYVYKGIARNVSKTSALTFEDYPVAIKITKAEVVDLDESELGETLAHAWLSHDPQCSPCMMCVYGLFVTKFDPSPSANWHYGIIMPWMNGDLYTLAGVISKKRPVLTDDRRFVWLMFIALYMIYDLHYMHASGWAHNDVKPENFLYDWPAGQALPKIKISDFGLSCAALKDHSLNTHRDYTDEIIKNFTIATGRPSTPIIAAETCNHLTTVNYQTPKWDAYTGRNAHIATTDITENYENDVYCVTMGLKALFYVLGFDMKNVVAQFYTGNYTQPGNYMWQQNQVNAWSLTIPTMLDMKNRATLRGGNIPFEMISNPALRTIGARFSRTIYQMGYENMSSGEALGYLAEQVEDAMKIENIAAP